MGVAFDDDFAAKHGYDQVLKCTGFTVYSDFIKDFLPASRDPKSS